MKGIDISFSLLIFILTVVYSIRVENPCGNRVPCDNGECIRRDEWCDGYNDCADLSDEKYCEDQSPDMCNDKHFFCINKRKCIPIPLVCDGVDDCDFFRNDDEKNCTFNEPAHSSQIEPENFVTLTTTTEVYTSNHPILISYYDTRHSESNNHNEYQDPQTPSRATSNRRNNGNSYDTRNPENPSLNNQYGSRTPQTSIGSRQDPPPLDNFSQQRTLNIWLYAGPMDHTNEITPNYTHFYFANNYTSDFEHRYRNTIKDAKTWLLNRRDNSYSWDSDTPRALIALSLLSNSFKSGDEDNELMKKSIQTHLGLKILRNHTGIEKMSTTRLAMYINALLATCQNPYNFLGVNLVESLLNTQNHMEGRQQFINPLIYLTLCLTDYPVHPATLTRHFRKYFTTQIEKDFHILATIAMACISHRHPHDNSIRGALDEAAQNLFNEMNPVNGSFGSKYTTALAVQALMSVNTRRWDLSKTLQHLAEQQIEDGSFGDMQSTYYTLIALSGRSLLHLRNTLCDTHTPDAKPEKWTAEAFLNERGEKVNITYTVRADYPNFIPQSQRLSVPVRANFIDIMRFAAYQNPRLKFNYKVSNGQSDVDMIANIPNDPERGMFWNFYWQSPSFRRVEERYTGDLNDITPRNNDEFTFWYRSDF